MSIILKRRGRTREAILEEAKRRARKATEGMTRITALIPIDIHSDMAKLVETGRFNSFREMAAIAIRRFVEQERGR